MSDQDTAIDLSESVLPDYSVSEMANHSQPTVKHRGSAPPSSYDAVHIERPVYSLAAFNSTHQYDPPKSGVKELVKRTCQSRCRCSARCCGKFLLGFLPFIGIFRRYKLKRDLVGDIVAGLTVGVMHIPQGLAYGMLTNLPAVYGLYCSFFPIMVYFFLGTSRHISLGTFAVVSLMVGNVVTEFQSVCHEESTNETAAALSNNTEGVDYKAELACKVGVAMACTFVVGFIQFMLGMLRVGFVTVYLSESLTRAFITGAAVHVATSQMKHVLGLNPQKYTGALTVIYTWIDLMSHLRSTNFGALLTSLVCIVFIYCSQRWLSPIVKKRCKGIPLPNELIMIILGTLISHFAHLNRVFGMHIVGDIPTGLPPPELPPWHRMPGVVVDAISIAIVAFAVNISMAKNFAKKHGYKLNSNQELLAYGMSNMVGSIFNSYVSAASLSRSIIQERVGGATQLAGLIACCLLAVILLAVGPLFSDLPNSVLAGIILINLKGVFLQITDIPKLFRISLWDMLVWIVTFSAVVVADVDIGLLAGVLFSLMTLVFRAQTPSAYSVGRLGSTEMYGSFKDYSQVADRLLGAHGIRVFRFSAPLCFANAERFIQRLIRATSCDPVALRSHREDMCEGAEVRIMHSGVQGSEPDCKQKMDSETVKQTGGITMVTVARQPSVENGSTIQYRGDKSKDALTTDLVEQTNSELKGSTPSLLLPSHDQTSASQEQQRRRSTTVSDTETEEQSMLSPAVKDRRPSSETSEFLKVTDDDEDDDDGYYDGRNGRVKDGESVGGKTGTEWGGEEDENDEGGDMLRCDVKFIVIDCSAMSYVDAMGLDTLKTVIEDYAAVSVQVLLAACSNSLYELLRKNGAFESCENEIAFVSVQDAVCAAISEHSGIPLQMSPVHSHPSSAVATRSSDKKSPVVPLPASQKSQEAVPRSKMA